MPVPPDFRSRCQTLLDRAANAGWQVEDERSIPYGRLFRLALGSARATLSCYHGKKGFRHVVAGKEADALEGVLGGTGRSAPSASGPSDDPFQGGLPRIGADESGKGDYFGPLVVAAFYVDDHALDAITKIGVRDSKGLSRSQALRMAGALDGVDRGAVLALHPPRYSDEYAAVRNVNTLLARLHGACITQLLSRAASEGWSAPRSVVVDRFAKRTDHLDGAMQRPPGTRLITAPKAEADPAVAAASILARASYLEALQALEQQYGMPFPPGAGTPVLSAGRAFVEAFGPDELVRVAKVHFATTQSL